MSSGFPPLDETVNRDHGFHFPNADHGKNNLRPSSSLQDLSSYRRVDVEEGGCGLGDGIDRKAPVLGREISGLSFSKEKGLPPGSPSPVFRKKFPRRIVVLLCLVFAGFVAYFVSVYVISNWSGGGSKFFVVLDCGSTGTRVYVYEAEVDHKGENSLPFVLNSLSDGMTKRSGGRAYDRMETEPGLHMLVHNTTGLKAALNPLVLWAKKQIPESAHKTTSVFLYATAGVRSLQNADSKWLLDKAFLILNESPFLCRREWVTTITGMEEAYYGWIALNYQNKVIGATPKKATFGALDMGGSSLQVTFENEKNAHNKTNLKLKIGNTNHHLSAYSLTGYGLNDAFDKSVFHIVKSRPSSGLLSGKIEIKHPCLQSGYKEEYTCSHCGPNQQESGSPIGGRKGLVKQAKPGVPVRLIGSPNWEECRALAKVAVNLSEWSNQKPGFDCDVQPCALPEYLPRPRGQFYAISGFFVVYRFFNLTPESTLDDVLEKGREFCEKAWEVAKSSVEPQPFIEQYCFRAPYVVLLLREGLHITDSQVIVGSGSITWTLGVALFEAGKAFSVTLRPHGYEVLQMKLHPLVLVAILLVCLILVVCALSCVGNWMPRFSRRQYLPFFWQKNVSATSVLSISSPFRLRWSPINTGEGRAKMPLSPTVAGRQQRPFSLGYGLDNSGVQLIESSLYPSTGGVSHSYSSNSLGQMIDSSSFASFWSPHRSQMRLQSRRSQSREDLNSSLAEAHLAKV